ncbi:MAG TPA: hypothetical protein VHK67_03745 [Rhabdochlamydiaceae bacterium]|jgi:hypothetical protein|nr:hypothetical protein [Rhabdochlamydiaceae bacterium]
MVEAVSHDLRIPESSALPKGTVTHELFELREQVKKLNDQQVRLNMAPLKSLHQELDELALKEMDAVKNVIDAEKTHLFWGYNQMLFSLGAAATSIIGGIYLIASGDNEGQKFIAAGCVTLANTLMDQLGGWTALSKLVSFGNETVEYAAGLLPYAISLFTIVYTGYTMVSVAQHHLMAWVSSALSYIETTLRIGTIYTTAKKGFADVHLIDIQSQTTIATKKIEPITRRNEALGESGNAFTSQTKRTLQTYNRINSAAMAH